MSRKEREEQMEVEDESIIEDTGDSTGDAAEPQVDNLRILEALLFASDELMTAARLKAILPGNPDARQIRKMVDKLNVQFQKERHPFEIVEIGGGYQFRTVSFYHTWVRQIFKEKAAKKLSVQALECLAIIAYKQPLSKAEIEAIRGVVSDGAMKTLLEKRLVTVAGRSEKPGRPLLYGTTQEFLKYFGLNKIVDLPKLEEFEAIAKEKMEDLSIDELQQNDEELDEEKLIKAEEEKSQASSDEKKEDIPVPESTAVFEIAIGDNAEEKSDEKPTSDESSVQPEDEKSEQDFAEETSTFEATVEEKEVEPEHTEEEPASLKDEDGFELETHVDEKQIPDIAESKPAESSEEPVAADEKSGDEEEFDFEIDLSAKTDTPEVEKEKADIPEKKEEPAEVDLPESNMSEEEFEAETQVREREELLDKPESESLPQPEETTVLEIFLPPKEDKEDQKS